MLAFWFEILNQRNNIQRILITELRSLNSAKHFPRKGEYVSSVRKRPLTFYHII